MSPTTTATPADKSLVDALRSQIGRPDTTTVKVTIELITPEQAAEYLLANTINRHLRGPAVAAYARDLIEGKWGLTGDSIKFDRNGKLADGQHRLRAVIEAGVPMLTVVARGVDPTARDLVDTGITRKSHDVLTFRGVRNSMNVAAVARLGVVAEAGRMVTTADGRNGGGQYRVTHAEVLDYIERHSDLEEFVAENIAYGRTIRGAIAAFLHAAYVLHELNEEKAKEFVRSLAEFNTSGVNDPRRAFLTYVRNALMDGRRVGAGEMVYLVYRTWNAWRNDEPLNKLATVSRSGPIRIPEPVA